MPTTAAYACDDVTGSDPVAHDFVNALIEAVKTHQTIAVIDDRKQTVTP